jgi:hypothetical protein
MQNMVEEGIAIGWYEANQRYLQTALAVLRARLERCLADLPPDLDAGRDELNQALRACPAPPALEVLCARFLLTPFERDILLLCAAVELDSAFAPICAAVHGDPQRSHPTFSLALAVLQDPHWSALSPGGALRRWRLVEVGPGNLLTLSPLRIDEQMLHYLIGIQHLDDRLAGIVEPVQAGPDLVPSHRLLAERVARLWSKADSPPQRPVVQLCGGEHSAKRDIALAACASLGLDLCAIPALALPTDPHELEALIRLCEREATAAGCAFLIDCDDLDTADTARDYIVSRLIDSTGLLLIVSTRERRRIRQRPMVAIDVHKPTTGEQRAVWQRALGSEAASLNGHVDALVAQFSLSLPAIYSVSTEAAESSDALDGNDLGQSLWEACRRQARPRLDGLAQRIESAAGWDDLVLPEMQTRILHEIAAHVRQRTQVYESWGFASRGLRGLGISALFAGASGTGKTLAAEVLSKELRLDLYHIDLSQVVSKYIGETEKNLRRVFDAAEEGGAILLFDEADALFGKRTEVKDSHDRYANIEVSYLLQRMEAYRGLAILTTNMKGALDPAFLRRIRFVVQFPFPDAPQRAAIWRRIFPPGTPTEGLDVGRLARLNVPGGNIRNIALSAAFLAADAGEPVRMLHLLRAAQMEYAKLERPLSEAEIGGWI